MAWRLFVFEPVEKPKNTLEQSILTSIKESNIKEEKPEILSSEEATSKNLEIGKPLDFSENEKHSFQEWLQLASFKPITREENEKKEKKQRQLQKLIRKKKKN